MKNELLAMANSLEEELENNNAVNPSNMSEAGYVLGRFASALGAYYYKYEIRRSPANTPESLKWNHKVLLKLNSQGKNIGSLFSLLNQTFRRTLKDMPFLHDNGSEYLRAIAESAYTVFVNFKEKKFDKCFEEAFIYGLNK
ncbi:MAG: hypothetical protein ACI4F9_00865 [Lachnospiraceae bacterium]